MSFNKVKQTYLFGGLVIALVAVLSWFFLVSPRIEKAGDIGEQQAAAEAVNAKSAAQIVALNKLKQGLPHEKEVTQALAVKFPPTADEPTLFRAVVAAAAKAGIAEKKIKSVGPAAPVMGGASGGGAKLAAAEAPAATDAAPAKGAAPAKATQELATMAITFNAEGNFGQMVAMIQNLENMDRSFLITQVNLSSAEGGAFTIALQGNMYVYRPVPPPETAVAARAGSLPAATPAAAPAAPAAAPAAPAAAPAAPAAAP